VAQVERAIEQSIDILDPDGGARRAKHLDCGCAGNSGSPKSACGERGCEAHLADELRAVLGLDADLRCCFVLPGLAGFTAAETVSLLVLGAPDVEAFTRAAILRLAGMAGGIQ